MNELVTPVKNTVWQHKSGDTIKLLLCLILIVKDWMSTRQQ